MWIDLKWTGYNWVFKTSETKNMSLFLDKADIDA